MPNRKPLLAVAFAAGMALASSSAFAGGGFWSNGGMAGFGSAMMDQTMPPDPYYAPPPDPYYVAPRAHRPQPLPFPPADRMTCMQFGNTVRCTQF